MTSLFDLTGRVVLATGAARGIGLGFLTGCARQGATVVIWDRDMSARDCVTEELLAAGAAGVHFEQVDVADEADVVRAFASTLAATGRVDCVFANAGITSRAPSFADMTSEMYRKLMGVNLDGAFFTLREATRHMRDRTLAGDAGGSLVVCGSLSIFMGFKGLEHYAGAKGALAAMVRSLAVELGEYGVRVNMIAPGFILTGMTGDRPETAQLVEDAIAVTPLRRVGTTSDIEGPAAYLASDASAFHTGDIMVLDGGRLAGRM